MKLKYLKNNKKPKLKTKPTSRVIFAIINPFEELDNL